MLDPIVRVYQAAFRAAPYDKREAEVAGFAEALPKHVRRDAFRFVGAFNESTDSLVGFAYGYTSQRGQWWYDVVRKALPPLGAIEWLTNAFQLTEIAVQPQAQGQSIGGRLHDYLLGGVPHARALLSTLDAETIAFKMYQERGWLTLFEHFYFPGVPRPYRIMGINLPRPGRD
jgi:GNAT superfamily N-acetyltransferase